MLPLKAGSLTQSSPPVRSLEGMQDRDHIWPPFHSDWYLECILSFFLFPSLHLLRHPNLLLGLSMAIHPYPPKLQEFGQEYAKSMGVSEATRQFSMFQLEIQDQKDLKNAWLIAYSTLDPSFLLWWPRCCFTRSDSESLVILTALTAIYCNFFGFEQKFYLNLQLRWLRKEIWLSNEKNLMFSFILGNYTTQSNIRIADLVSHNKNPYSPTNIMGRKKQFFHGSIWFTKALIIHLIASRGRIHRTSYIL